MYNLYLDKKTIADYPFYSSVDNKPEMVLTYPIESDSAYFESLIVETQSNQL
jgi:hypothetical protein